jgi:hypothetical protein
VQTLDHLSETTADDAHAEAIWLAECARMTGRDSIASDQVALLRATTHACRGEYTAAGVHLRAAESMRRMHRVERDALLDAYIVGLRDKAVTR